MTRANPFYARTQKYTTTERHALRSPIKVVQAEVSIEDYLHDQGVGVRRNRARCLVHGGDNPTSFSIDPERQRWHCFACGESGDLIDLCELVERHADTWTAVVSLAMRFDVQLPEKSEKWRKWQNQKAEIRDFNERIRHERRIRRWFRLYHRDDLRSIANPEERRAETERCWRELRRWTPRPDWWGAA
jgi:DNA primase